MSVISISSTATRTEEKLTDLVGSAYDPLVEPPAFADSMTEFWVREFRNIPNPAGQAGWTTMAEVFNKVIAQNTYRTNPFTNTAQTDAPWYVVKALTGTGKTQGLAKFCSMLPKDRSQHPGALIITRLKIEATELADRINTLACTEVATAYHGKHKFPRKLMRTFPVLVLTHRAYEVGLDKVNSGQAEASNWDAYHAWGRLGQTRALVVIDEALDIIKLSQVTLETVKQVIASIPEEVAMRHPHQLDAMRCMEDVLRKMAHVAETRKLDVREHERVLWKGEMRLPTTCDMSELRKELKNIALDRGPLGVSEASDKISRRAKLRDAIGDIEAALDNWNWYSKKLREHTINTARLIVPSTIHSACVLDATASQSIIYKLFNRAEVIALPQSREYSSATLHYSLGHKLGKVEMKKHAPVLCRQLMDNLRRTLGPLPDGTPTGQRRVFVATHKALKPFLLQHVEQSGFGELSVESFGRIRGRNQWRHFDTVVMFGLPFTDSTWAPNMFFALQGIQSSAWLNDPTARNFESYTDVRKALDWGHMIAEVVQTLNRGRSRQPSRASGDCEPVDLFVLLPQGEMGRAILNGVQTEMPGIATMEWDYEHLKQRKRGVKAKAGHEGSVVAHCASLTAGSHTAHDIQKTLGISNRNWKQLVGATKDPESSLSKALAALQVRYLVTREGKRYLASFVKSST